MAKRSIAVVLLVAITAWAEMALAPMLAMSHGHMRPRQAVLAEVPASHIGTNHGAHHDMDHAQLPGGLACCPGLHEPQPVATLELVSGAPACDDTHSCCFRQGPQSVPGGSAPKITREMAPAHFAVVNPERRPATRQGCERRVESPPPPAVFGMVLRV